MIATLHNILAWAPLGLPAFVFVITLVVFVHELGHFLVARACGVKVEVFSICFGREIVGWTDRHGTRWKIGWIPLGGYVKFLGDTNAASVPDREETERLSPEERAHAFPLKPLYQRAMIVVAGPVANFILAIAIFTVSLMIWGRAVSVPRVDSVSPQSPAAYAGIRPGDIIRSIDGSEVHSFLEVRQFVALSAGESLDIVVDRQGRPASFRVAPRPMMLKNDFGEVEQAFVLGIGNTVRPGDFHMRRLGPVEALGGGVTQTWQVVKGTFSYTRRMITGHADSGQMRGPLGIAKMSQQVASVGFAALVQLAALISVSLGLVNLFPIPLLDGGHLLYYACEAVLGRPLGERAQDVGFRLGLALVLGLMLLVTWNDLARLNLF